MRYSVYAFDREGERFTPAKEKDLSLEKAFSLAQELNSKRNHLSNVAIYLVYDEISKNIMYEYTQIINGYIYISNFLETKTL